jgi:hypothetical protein
VLWLSIAVLLAGGITVGYYAHLWWCQRRNGCPVWQRKNMKEWSPKAEVNGWRARRRKGKGPSERHPTGEVQTQDDPWADWRPEAPLDKAKEPGAPLTRIDTPVTDMHNPTRRTR